MKIWVVLGILLITAMGTFIPCCPSEDCYVESGSIGLAGQTENPEEGPCSPFFACPGCMGFVSVSKSIDFSTTLPLQVVYNEYHSIANLTNYASLCWQPPRAGFIS